MQWRRTLASQDIEAMWKASTLVRGGTAQTALQTPAVRGPGQSRHSPVQPPRERQHFRGLKTIDEVLFNLRKGRHPQARLLEAAAEKLPGCGAQVDGLMTGWPHTSQVQQSLNRRQKISTFSGPVKWHVLCSSHTGAQEHGWTGLVGLIGSSLQQDSFPGPVPVLYRDVAGQGVFEQFQLKRRVAACALPPKAVWGLILNGRRAPAKELECFRLTLQSGGEVTGLKSEHTSSGLRKVAFLGRTADLQILGVSRTLEVSARWARKKAAWDVIVRWSATSARQLSLIRH